MSKKSNKHKLPAPPLDPILSLNEQFDLLGDLKKSIDALGSEFTDTAISKAYFYKIFNEIDNFVFISNLQGEILDYNKKFALEKDKLHNLKFLLNLNEKKLLKTLSDCVDKNNTRQIETQLLTKNKKIPVSVKFTLLDQEREPRIIVTCSDLTYIKAKETESKEQIILSQEGERNRVAQDLHDEIGQQISGLRIYLNIFSKHLIGNEKAELALKKSQEIVDSMAEEIRRVCINLMPRSLKEHGLIKGLQSYLTKNYERLDVHIHFSTNNPELHYTEDFAIHIYRIVQEFVSNSYKHGNCKNIWINLHCKNKVFLLTLKDDGKGFDIQTKSQGMGLSNIQTRAEFINAKTEWKSLKNLGTTLLLKCRL